MIVNRNKYRSGHLQVQANRAAERQSRPPGLKSLDLDGKRDGKSYIPKNYNPDVSAPLAVMLHGAGGDAQHGISLLQDYADEYNIILVAPVSRDYSWDIIARGSFGPDVIYLEEALTKIFHECNIDTSRVAIGGFSDGASYALSLGLINGTFFTHIIAFSPGFAQAEETRGKPCIFMSHGTADGILPIDACSRKIIMQLDNNNYDTLYREFEGEHTIPTHISKAAVEWFLNKTVTNKT